MPVFEIGDLIMGDLSPAASPFEVSTGGAEGIAGRAAGACGYILGVIAGTAPSIPAPGRKSSSGPPTKSYPGH
jgi:hypothetical protein